MRITPDTDLDADDLGVDADRRATGHSQTATRASRRAQRRTSSHRQARLQRNAQRLTKTWDLTLAIDPSHRTAHINMEGGTPHIVVSGREFPQPVTDYDADEWDWLCERVLTAHESGHDRYTDHADFIDRLDDIPSQYAAVAKRLWNALEDGAIEAQLRERWPNYSVPILHFRANLFHANDPGRPNPDGDGRLLTLAEALTTACLDLATYDSETTWQLLDPNDDSYQFASQHDRKLFLDLFQELQATVDDVLTAPDPIARNARIFDFIDDVLDVLPDADDDGADDMAEQDDGPGGLPDDSTNQPRPDGAPDAADQLGDAGGTDTTDSDADDADEGDTAAGSGPGDEDDDEGEPASDDATGGTGDTETDTDTDTADDAATPDSTGPDTERADGDSDSDSDDAAPSSDPDHDAGAGGDGDPDDAEQDSSTGQADGAADGAQDTDAASDGDTAAAGQAGTQQAGARSGGDGTDTNTAPDTDTGSTNQSPTDRETDDGTDDTTAAAAERDDTADADTADEGTVSRAPASRDDIETDDDVRDDLQADLARELEAERNEQTRRDDDAAALAEELNSLAASLDSGASDLKSTSLDYFDDSTIGGNPDVWDTADRMSDRLKHLLPLDDEKETETQRNQRRGRIDSATIYRVNVGSKHIKKQRTRPDDPDINICLVLDRSSSMGGQKMETAETALLAFALALEYHDVNVMVLELYNDRARLACPFEQSLDQRQAALTHGKTAGSTPLSDALTVARERLKLEHEGLNRVIVVTDGEPNDDDRYTDALDDCSFPVTGINIRPDGDQQATGTEYYHRSIAASPDGTDLQQKLMHIARELLPKNAQH